MGQAVGDKTLLCIVSKGNDVPGAEHIHLVTASGDLIHGGEIRTGAIGVANALTSAELVLSGIHHHIPFDEMAEAMLHVGRSLPFELRETAMGGCAGTPTGCSLGCDICRK